MPAIRELLLANAGRSDDLNAEEVDGEEGADALEGVDDILAHVGCLRL